MFAELAEERCQRLREQLEAGEVISRTLRSELDASSRPAKSRR
jgi:hypothetical protein